MKLKTWLIHLKINLFGSREMTKKGKAKIPCKCCDRLFVSKIHRYTCRGETYDTICTKCLPYDALWNSKGFKRLRSNNKR